MRYAIISDIHSNLEALQSVFEACRNQNIDTILCLGDSVGYGANPQDCLTILKKVDAICVAGNHDWAVSGKLDASYFPRDGVESFSWTRNKLSFEEIDLLSSFNLVYQSEECIISHSSLSNPGSFIYLSSIDKSLQTFEVMNQPICFLGHTHVPRVFIQRGRDVVDSNIFEFELNLEYKYIVNVGSVGQPRDGNPMASYCLYDAQMKTVELKRVQYDVKAAKQKIIDAGLPLFLAERLTYGK